MLIEAIAAGAIAGLSSTPHCAVMCGPLAAFACRGGRAGSASRVLRYQLGRLLGYATLGASVGLLGGEALSVMGALGGRWGSALLSWLVALSLAVAALRMWRRSPAALPRPADALVPLRPAVPRRRRGLRDLHAAALARVPRGPLSLGLATALLPCGALAAGLALAAASGAPSSGALLMMSFAGASGLGLLAIGAVVSRVGAAGASRRVLAVGLAIGAVLLALRPLPSLRAPAGAVPACHQGAHP